jgi:D-alanyl-D-alanine dipeptidase
MILDLVRMGLPPFVIRDNVERLAHARGRAVDLTFLSRGLSSDDDRC